MKTIEYIKAHSEPEPNTGCWLWEGALDRFGYGRISGKLAHRISYAAHYGEMAPGLVTDHLCRVHCCVNPRHLEAVTQHENMRRGINATKSACVNGHPFDEENTYRYRGKRYCRACNRETVARSTKERRTERTKP